MSIYGLIDYWVKEKRLFELQPALGSHIRRMLVSQSVNNLITGPWPNTETALRCGRLEADLEKFLDGSRIEVARRPYKGKTSYMLRLDPEEEEVWEIRSRDPEPQLRVFGRFADTDVFVGLTAEVRDNLKNISDEGNLWREVRIQCQTEWTNLFRPYKPKSGTNFPYDYISANVILI
jgi:hypothetical protein